MVVPIVMNVNLVVFLKRQVESHVFGVLVDIHKLKKVKQDVLNAYLEKSTITKVVFSAMNVTLVDFLKHLVEKHVQFAVLEITKTTKVKRDVSNVLLEDTVPKKVVE